ncbi:MAG TPA: TlpA disulfide reductase family protein, partial [Polyangiaceae bacterium]|nr:TlpA disulfide reductase family protein [Polyangiaceae bacterium]
RLAPDFELPQVGGGKVRLSSFRGKTVILNFWSKSCPPCLEEMPSIAGLAKVLRERKDIVLLTVTTDDSAEDARDTLRSVLGADAPFVTLIDPDAKVVTDLYGTKLYPETWFIDPKGVIRARFDGARDWASALVVELAESLQRPYTCDVEFRGMKPAGDSAFVCSDLSRN